MVASAGARVRGTFTAAVKARGQTAFVILAASIALNLKLLNPKLMNSLVSSLNPTPKPQSLNHPGLSASTSHRLQGLSGQGLWSHLR